MCRAYKFIGFIRFMRFIVFRVLGPMHQERDVERRSRGQSTHRSNEQEEEYY